MGFSVTVTDQGWYSRMGERNCGVPIAIGIEFSEYSWAAIRCNSLELT